MLFQIILPLTCLINLYFKEIVFPIKLKHAKIYIFVKKSEKNVGKYKPISLHSIVSKVYETQFLQMQKSLLSRFEIIVNIK